MPMQHNHDPPRPDPHDAAAVALAGPIGHRLAAGADARVVAGEVAAAWAEIDEVLHPIIGHGGVLALYNRSLKLAAARHPWLSAAQAGALAAIDVSALQVALARQTPAEALAAGDELLHRFRELLRSLIGDSLTDRLLGTVWGPAPPSVPVQDKAP